MRIISLNLNGIRSAARKGVFAWLVRQKADVVCFQETRIQLDQLAEDRVFYPRSFNCYYHCAERKGYSGVGLLSRREPDEIVEGIGWSDVDSEGRYIEARYPGLSVISIYLPSGTSGDERQEVKMGVLKRLLPHLRELRASGREYVLCGDFNIAHKAIDLKNWRSNQKNSGFLPEEREWMDELLGSAGFVDAFRATNAEPEQYTWWSNRGQSWAKNVGWRIDYQIATPGLGARVNGASIYKTRRFSDHAPLTIDYDYTL